MSSGHESNERARFSGLSEPETDADENQTTNRFTAASHQYNSMIGLSENPAFAPVPDGYKAVPQEPKISIFPYDENIDEPTTPRLKVNSQSVVDTIVAGNLNHTKSVMSAGGGSDGRI